MTGRPIQDIRIWRLQHRSEKARPWSVRWAIDGRHRSRAFRTKAEADRYRSQLLVAQQSGLRFDEDTGEPADWSEPVESPRLVEWARRWLAEEWAEWAPRTRDSNVEGLARFVVLAVDPDAPEPPEGIRRYLDGSLRPGVELDQANLMERWLLRWSARLSALDAPLLADVDRRLGLGDRGQALAPNTSNRYRRTARSCVGRAVELKELDTDPWPPTPAGRARRKARRQPKAVDGDRLPDPATMHLILQKLVNHQPASRMYQAMTAVSYYAGLRPSETAMLRPRALQLAGTGEWGRLNVVEADDGYDEPAEPKTGRRPVPIPPQLAAVLSAWISRVDCKDDQLMFRTRGGKRPSQSNWNRALKRASGRAGHAPISAYDCRHACATTWLRAGVPLGEVALRLGHSVETLVSYYVGALQGDDLVANERILETLPAEPPLVSDDDGDPPPHAGPTDGGEMGPSGGNDGQPPSPGS
jgi:integrase